MHFKFCGDRNDLGGKGGEIVSKKVNIELKWHIRRRIGSIFTKS
jgi:hypothetical protein